MLKTDGQNHSFPLKTRDLECIGSDWKKPADMAEIRVYFQRRFLCRAICPELSEAVVSRAEIVAARRERRMQERGQLRERKAIVKRFGVKRPAELADFVGEKEEADRYFESREEKQEINGLKRYEDD